jgi:GGDEF domain-containing protein/tetratricopeptide (TPR) repeat protein
MSEIAKRLERADKFLQKGKLPSALEELRAALQEDSSNDMVRQRAADLCISLNLTDDAAGYLADLFDHLVAQGRSTEAISTYKKLTRLSPTTTARTFKYAQLMEKANPREALEALNASFLAFLKNGERQHAMEALKRMIVLDPSPTNCRREAELAESMGDYRASALAFLQLGRMEESAGNEGAEMYSRAYSLDPTNPTAALFHSRCLMRGSRAEEAVEVLRTQPLTTADFLETYANALLLANQAAEAEPITLQLYGTTSHGLAMIAEVLSTHMRTGNAERAADFAREVEDKVRAKGEIREFLGIVGELVEKHPVSTDFLEYLAQLYNGANREHEYCDTLLKLFQLYFAQRNFAKAAECLDRASEADAYEPGHQERLEMLRGKIDTNKYNAIANRLQGVGNRVAEDDEPEQEEALEETKEDKEPTVLEDLMLQAEIFLQYSMRSKAVERLERIHKLFPHEEEKREKLAQLYAAAGFVPKYADVVQTATAGAKNAANEDAVDNFARVTEITRNIARQSSIKAVLFATVNDVGRHWNVSRCVAGLSSPGKAPSAAMEYCAPGTAKSDVMGLARLISTLQAQVVKAGGAVSFHRAAAAPELESLRPILTSQNIESLMAVPLKDGHEQLGIVILEQCGAPRTFKRVDEVVLNTIAEQIVLAVNNARLRSLVKSLAPTDEKSGLLRRSSYLDVLLSEVQRSLVQKSPVTLALLSFGSASAMIKEVGEVNVDAGMQEIGHMVTANIRQNDVAVRYGLTSIGLILSDTNDKNAFFVLDKLRKVTEGAKIPGRGEPVVLTAGIAELVMQPRFDAVDIVTEAINRVENALEIARHEGGNKAHSLAATIELSAVSA